MTARALAGLGMAVVLGVLSSVAYGAGPTFWQISTEAELLRGEVDNLSIDAYGRLTLGQATSQVYEANAPFLWAMAQGPDGAFYVGSGNEGQVYRIDTTTGAGRVFFDADELEVHALAFAPDGTLYVATSPDGRIYKVDTSGAGVMLFDPPDKYIWSLAVDRDGNVFAGTGDKGVVYRITPDGRGTPFYQTKSTHAMSLAVDSENRLLVGTESPARIFRVDASGRAFVLLDAPYTEIHALRIDGRGNIWVAAVGGRPTGGAPPPAAAATPEPAAGGGQPVVTVSTEFSSVVIADTGSVTQAAQPRPTGALTGAVYRLAPDGAADLIWESREDSPYDLTIENDDSVLVATGNRGKIYRLSGEPLRPTLIARATAQQVTAMTRARSGELLFATSNPGRVFKLAAMRADRGTYTSDVRDAQNVATWGTIRWQALVANGSRVEITTRTGNTRTPDDTWSDWSAAYAAPEGSQIVSPRARYIQWRAVLVAGRGDAPILSSVVTAYLPRNTRPKVTAITINPPGTIYQRPFPTGDPEIQGFEGEPLDRRFAAQTAGSTLGTTPGLGRRAYQKGLLTFVWRAEDDNRDDLLYDVLYRREGETTWRTLRKELPEAILAWDTTSVPNGRYILRVVAADSPSNSPSTTLTGSLDSATFDIDNTAPSIVMTGSRRDGQRTTLTFEVRDQDSAVQRVEYSLDGDKWQALYPADGIADSRVEKFDLTLDSDLVVRGVTIRATDALNNIGSGRGEPPAASGGR